jgi:hypothetical protein
VESFAIVRQRLFEEPGADAQADIAAVARVFTDFYAKNRAEFPAGVAEPSYEERIESAYPLTRSCSTGCTATGRRWIGSSAPAACCG